MLFFRCPDMGVLRAGPNQLHWAFICTFSSVELSFMKLDLPYSSIIFKFTIFLILIK